MKKNLFFPNRAYWKSKAVCRHISVHATNVLEDYMRVLCKYIFFLISVICISALFGCVISEKNDITSSATENDVTSESNSEIIGEQSFEFGDIPFNSDGIIEPMSYEEIKEKAMQINSESTVSDLVDLFGDYPDPMSELNINCCVYYCGDYEINMFGIPIVTVSIYNLKNDDVEVLYNVTAK